jgi:hypothetical protein
MPRWIQFGERVEGYDIPVLNEREIRAAAGILFLMMFITINIAAGQLNFTPIKYAVCLFLVDICVRVFVNPRFSPFLILGRLIVRKQTPEYVGAAQKRFAWIIGVVLAATMFVLMVAMNTYSPVTGIICFVCLIFLFFETAFGICLGCKVYGLVYRKKARYCPGEVCEANARQPISKTSLGQILIVIGFLVLALGGGKLFHQTLSQKPQALFGQELIPPGAPEN